jgi:hypothetical protein
MDAQNYLRLHDHAIVIDTHNDILTACFEKHYSFDHDLKGKTHSTLAHPLPEYLGIIVVPYGRAVVPIVNVVSFGVGYSDALNVETWKFDIIANPDGMIRDVTKIMPLAGISNDNPLDDGVRYLYLYGSVGVKAISGITQTIPVTYKIRIWLIDTEPGTIGARGWGAS